MEQPIGIRLPKELLKKIEELSKKQMEDRSTTIRRLVIAGHQQLLKEKAVEAYMQEKITLSEAAKAANLTIWEMQKYLIDKGFKSDYSMDDLEKELESLD